MPRLLPALRGCLEGGATSFADAGWPIGEDLMGIRLRRGGQTSYCIARAEDGAVLHRLPLAEAPAADPAVPAFFLERRCADARRVSAADGTVLGWLAYPGC